MRENKSCLVDPAATALVRDIALLYVLYPSRIAGGHDNVQYTLGAGVLRLPRSEGFVGIFLFWRG